MNLRGTSTVAARHSTGRSRARQVSGPLGTALAGVAMSALAVLAGWAALWSWSPLLERPQRFLWVALATGAVVVVIGVLGRMARLPFPLVLLLQAAGCLVLLNHHFAAGSGWSAWAPSPAHLDQLLTAAQQGSATLNKYASPIPAGYTDAVVFLAIGGTLVLLAMDLFACGLRRATLAGLPLLLTLTIPISVLTGALSVWVFLGTAVPFLALLAWQHLSRMHSWGREVGSLGTGGRLASLLPVTAGVGVVALIGALLLPGLVPVGHGLQLHGKGGSGSGGGNSEVTVANPIIDLHKDLLTRTHTPMLTARTNAPDPSYLRLAVLDDFTGTQWRPSVRRLPTGNAADGAMPKAPGITNAIPGVITDWVLHLAGSFRTSWLPTPYPTVNIHVPGDWRYDAQNLDIVNVDGPDHSRGLRYSLEAFAPDFSAQVLEASSFQGADEIERSMTALPGDVPPVIGAVARRVTRGAGSEYDKLVRLQNWFRSSGGFRYSTAAGPGSGMQLIADFITRDKVGYCEQFAAAMALMGRTLGIPSRVVVGFLHPKQVGKNTWLYTSDNLHSWPEFYFGGAGWVRFEPTPGVHTGAAPRWSHRTQSQQQPQHLPSIAMPSAPTPTRHLTAPQEQDQHRGGSVAGQGTPLWPALGVLLFLAGVSIMPWLVRSRRRRRWLSLDQGDAQLVRGAWAELRATAIDNGIGWLEQRSPRQTLGQLRARITADPDLVAELEWFTVLVEQARYAPEVRVGPAERERLQRMVHDWTVAIRENAPDRARRWSRVLPRTVLERDGGPGGMGQTPGESTARERVGVGR